MVTFTKKNNEGLSLRSDPSQIKSNLTGQEGKDESSVFNSSFSHTPFLALLKCVFSRIINFISSILNFIFSIFIKRSNINIVPRMVSGFTLVELLVTITMFVIITGVVLVNSNKFDSSILLNNFAYDVALTIKQAQSYGVNVRETAIGTFNESYGVYFDLSTDGSNTNLILFSDINKVIGDNPIYKYDNYDSVKTCPTDNVECIQKFSMRKGTYISKICAISFIDNNCVNKEKVSILFRRPNLSAEIYADTEQDRLKLAEITLASSDGTTSTVVVTSIGQIYVK